MQSSSEGLALDNTMVETTTFDRSYSIAEILLKLQDMNHGLKQHIFECASQQRDSILELSRNNEQQFKEI